MIGPLDSSPFPAYHINPIGIAVRLGAWLAKANISSAVKVMPPDPDLWHLFGVHWRNKFFAVRLTFGRRSSPLLDLASSVPSLYHHVSPSANCKSELRLWQLLLANLNGISLFYDDLLSDTEDIQLFTDAAPSVGFGGYYKGQWFAAPWPPDFFPIPLANQSSALLEIFPIVVAASLWGHNWKQKLFGTICPSLIHPQITLLKGFQWLENVSAEPGHSPGTPDRLGVGASLSVTESLPVCSPFREGVSTPSPPTWKRPKKKTLDKVREANINFKWDPKSLEIRTLAVERLLEPLVTQVTTLVNSSNKGPSNKKKGRSKKAHVLAASVETATQNFLEKGDKIAKESQFLKEELTAAVEDVRKQGESMKTASGEFADDPCSSVKRGNMVRAARALLSAVTHLLVLADMADVYKLLVQLKLVEENLVKVRNAGTEQELGIQYKALKPEVDKLNMMAAKRQQELKDVHHKDQMAAARGVLQRNIPMLYTASQACLQHPDVAAYKANRDLIYKQLQQAVSGISNAAQATASEDSALSQPGGGGELAYALNNFDVSSAVKPETFSEYVQGPSLEERLESIISGAALMADSSCTRDDRRERIVAECNSVRQALQDLLSEYMGNVGSVIGFRDQSKAGRKERSDALNSAIDRMTKKTRDLRRQLRKAVMDHVSDSFLETNVPLLVLIEAAKNGNEKEVKEYAQVFREHANKLIEVANLACSISNNEEGVKLVRMAASQLETLCPQVINAALALAAKPNSKVAQDNMDLFKDQWERQVRVLTDAVDDITSIDDFLCVSENHILEDVNKCVIALQEKDVDGLDRTAGAIRGRAARVVHVVTSEMDNYEPGVYTEKVLEATKLLTDTVMPRFSEQVEAAVEALSANPAQPVDENEFIDASRLVYDGVRDIRKAVLMIRTPEELDDSDFETEDFDVRSRTSVQTEDDQLIAGQSARAIMAQLPQEQKAKIAEQVASFQEEKSKLDAEVSKWDDSGNDIIVLAKQMCMIMMEMTDFTRGKGPLKNTSDVISAAKKIAEAGSRMDKLGRTIADHCPDSACKQDLLAYLQRIALYCHQLNICSKVKAEVQNLGGELVVSGVDSAMSLIQAAKNLMNTVVSTVKASYVASTKYQKSQGMQSLNLPAISWKMKAPEKKPLVKREKQDDGQTNKVKRSSQKKHINPVQALSEFKAMDSI
ncbi:CTNA1 protein, partial [Atractosteus spatula]|nr:CTNA1 protein [Atractosteus spatula]